MLLDLNYFARRVGKGFRNLPSLLRGYNLYTDTNKLDLISRTFKSIIPKAESFVDLGGVWKVNAAYTFFTLRSFPIFKAYLVDFRFNDTVRRGGTEFPNLIQLQGNFCAMDVINQIGHVDVAFFFDVLLHQVNPNWEEVLRLYSAVADCFVIFNQQHVKTDRTFRLTDLTIDEYKATVPAPRQKLYEFIFSHRNDHNEEFNRKWIDIPDIFQWAISDHDLRIVMKNLGYKEVFFKNYGRFSYSNVFENHGFIFVKERQKM